MTYNSLLLVIFRLWCIVGVFSLLILLFRSWFIVGCFIHNLGFVLLFIL